jgi:hypothetical protein
MKKFFFSLFSIYLLIVITHFLLGWISSKVDIPRYSFNDISLLLPNELQNKKITTIQYIIRRHEVYIFTDTNDFYIFNIKTMKKLFQNKLPINSKIKSIKCVEDSCILLTENIIKQLQIKGYTDRSINIQPFLSDAKIQDIDKLIYYDSSTLIYLTNKKFVSYNNPTAVTNMRLDAIQRIQKISDMSNFEFINEGHSFWLQAYYRTFMKINILKLGDYETYRITSFLNLHNIKKIAIDDEVFYSPLPKNVIFMNANGELYQAKTTTSLFRDIHNFTRPFAYLPMLFMMMFA